MKRPYWFLVPAIILFFWLALNSMIEDSPTMDEQNHLARGLAFLRTGDPRLSVEHPPLVNTISALPLLTLPEIRLPTDHPSWTRPQGWYEFADLFLWEYNNDVTRMIFLARLPVVFLTLALALVAFHFSQRLWGPPAGIIAFLLLLFDPNVLAHGRYVTTDLGGALFVFLAAFLTWRHWQSPTPARFLLAAVGLGLAYGSKLSALIFGPIFALMTLLPLYNHRWTWQRALRRLFQFAAMNVIALFAVWALFGFQWGPLQFASPYVTSLNGVPGPMPTFWTGVEQVLLISGGGRPSFLLGETSTTGFTTYFPVAFVVKMPLMAIMLLVISLLYFVMAMRNSSDLRRTIFLLLPISIYFLVSMQSGLNIGFRHLLPIVPFIYVVIAGAMARFFQRWTAQHPKGKNLAAVAASALVLISISSALLVHPHYLSYFNALAGGPENGYRILVDSNVDWGQDIIRLKSWMEENNVSRVNLSWFGTADPHYYDIAYEPLPGLPRHFDLWWAVPFNTQDPAPGVYAISVSNLWELPLQDDKNTFSWFRARQPSDRVAYSILIYEVE